MAHGARMRRTLLLLGLLLALSSVPAAAEPIPLARAVALVAERYHGRMVEAEVRPGRGHERTHLVYELRWLTPEGQVLRIRVSATDGAMLEVDGHGMLAARRR